MTLQELCSKMINYYLVAILELNKAKNQKQAEKVARYYHQRIKYFKLLQKSY